MAPHVSEAMVIVGGTPESLELAMGIDSGDLSCHPCDNYWIPHPHSILPQVDRSILWCIPMSSFQQTNSCT